MFWAVTFHRLHGMNLSLLIWAILIRKNRILSIKISSLYSRASEEDRRRATVIKAAKRWLYHIIPALLLYSLTTLPLFQPSFHLSAAFKTCQLTFQRAGWTSWCLCGGLPVGLCVALSVDRHMGCCLCVLENFCHSHCSHCQRAFNVYAFHFFSLFLWVNSDLLNYSRVLLTPF